MTVSIRTSMLIVMALLIAVKPAVAQFKVDVVSDPADVKFYYGDLHNFLTAWQMIRDGSDLAETLKREYLDKASPGLRNYPEAKCLVNLNPGGKLLEIWSVDLR